MYNSDSTPNLSNCRFHDNSAHAGKFSSYGGAMFNIESDPTLINCTLTRNMVLDSYGGSGLGGGIYNIDSNPTVISSILNLYFAPVVNSLNVKGLASTAAITRRSKSLASIQRRLARYVKAARYRSRCLGETL